jgi:hypothetical protein
LFEFDVVSTIVEAVFATPVIPSVAKFVTVIFSGACPHPADANCRLKTRRFVLLSSTNQPLLNLLDGVVVSLGTLLAAVYRSPSGPNAVPELDLVTVSTVFDVISLIPIIHL